LICLAVFAEEYRLALKALERFGEHVELVELRLDTADGATIETAVASLLRPLILSCRAASHGGRFKGTEAERLALLRASARFRPLYIDVELGTVAEELFWEVAEQPFILSFHDPNGTPQNLSRIARALIAKKPALAKIVPRVTKWQENFQVLELAKELRKEGQRFICFGAGQTGLYSRALAPAYGSSITYCTAEGATPTGPGQFKVSQAIELFRLHKITDGWRVYGIVGNPIAHSFSPAFHNSLFTRYDIDAIYLPFPAEDFGSFFEFASRAELAGLSVTSPFKLDAADVAERGDETSKATDSVNTLVRSKHGYRAYNTDGAAFLEMFLRYGHKITGMRILILGSGGAARSLAYPLTRAGAQVTICSRNIDSGLVIAEQTGCRFSCDPVDLAAADVVVNTTTITKPDEDTEGFLRRNYPVGALAVDLHYDPPETFFLKEAGMRGCRTINGLEMFIRQAILQFKLWTGIEPTLDEAKNIPLFRL
jgi:3-dehydroquinate dehydratase/shikimate dehydrogenase